MQVVDDAFYIQRYYELVIKYSHLMSEDKILCMNQRLMGMWIDKAIRKTNERIKEFIEKFSIPCIHYLLLVMSEKRIFKGIDREYINIEAFAQEIEKGNHLIYNYVAVGIRNRPFYLSLYSKYADLYELLEMSIGKDIGLSRVGKLKKANLRKGLNNYKKLGQEERKRFLKVFCKAEVE